MNAPHPFGHGWRTRLPVMERAWRMMGMYDAANRVRLYYEACDRAVAAGRDTISEYEWYDRGQSQDPELTQDELGGRISATFGPISVGLQPIQMLKLWLKLTLATFPDIGKAYEALNFLDDALYGKDGKILAPPFRKDSWKLFMAANPEKMR